MRAVISRKIDGLGRIVLPKELRRELGIDTGTLIEIFVQADDSIVLRKSKYRCVVCGSEHIDCEISGDNFCSDCVANIKRALL
jgi:transcriptional pleiotropic regulator of transition state genes